MRKLAIPIATLLLLSVAGCSAKHQERGKDAPIAARDDKPAEVLNFPDGFGNVAHKCGPKGMRVFVLYHGDEKYGSVAVVADPSCP